MPMPLISIPAGLQTNSFLLAPGAIDYLPELLKTDFPGKTPWLVADGNTWRVAGEKARALLNASGFSVTEYVFSAVPKLHPDHAYSEMLAKIMPANCVPVAVGSGVVNDLVKCASGINGVRYCCVPTACSVDGYTSAGAALVVKGSKITVKCLAPYAICADSHILATAPSEMLASGYADLFAKIPAGGDWIIADELGQQPIRPDVWELIQSHLRGWVSDKNNLLNVFEGLAATGYAMQMMQDSRPASGAEHLYSHIWEMEGLCRYKGEEASHGFKVALGTLASTLLQEYVINHSFEELRDKVKPALTRAERIAEIDELLKLGCYGTSPKETALKKFMDGDAIQQRRKLIAEHWDAIRARLKKQIIPFAETREILRAAGCPVTPREQELTDEQFLHGIRTSQLIRIRYTVMDLLYESGLLDDALQALSVMMKG